MLPVDLSNGDLSGLSAILRAGDANGDNIVYFGDSGILVNAYNSDATAANSGYDTRADHDGDGMVDIGDFGLLVNNYNKAGDL